MLYGCPIITVYTDHKNNTFRNLNTQRVLHWWLFLDDYGVHFGYIPGETNKLADALSCLPYNERQNPSTLYAASPDLDLDDDTGKHNRARLKSRDNLAICWMRTIPS